MIKIWMTNINIWIDTRFILNVHNFIQNNAEYILIFLLVLLVQVIRFIIVKYAIYLFCISIFCGKEHIIWLLTFLITHIVEVVKIPMQLINIIDAFKLLFNFYLLFSINQYKHNR